MMRNKHLLYSLLAASLLTTASCDYNEDNFPGYDELAHPTDVRNDTLNLVAADYKNIAGLRANMNLAASKDVGDSLSIKALEAVGTNGYFTEDAPALWYLPAYLDQQYPYLDDNSKVTIHYKEYVNLPAYLKDFNGITDYQLSSEDYQLAWGDNMSAKYLSPSTIDEIPAILNANNPNAKEGDMLRVNYAYSETEPTEGVAPQNPADMIWTLLHPIPARAGGGSWDFINVGPVDLSAFKGQTINVAFKYTSSTSEAPTWELKNFKALSVPYLDVYLFAKQDDGSFRKLEYDFAAGDYVIVALGADNNYYPFGRLDNDDDKYGYMYPEPISVNGNRISAEDGAYYTLSIETSENGYTLKNALGKYLYMSGTYNNFNVSDEIGDEGYEWTIENTGGADLFTITNVDKEKSVKLNYYVNSSGKASYSYGSYPASTINQNVYVSNSLVGDEGGFSIYDVKLEGLNYVWTNDSQYGWKASGYAGGSNRESESYLISPSITIGEDAVLPYFTIDEAINYGTWFNLTMWAVQGYSTPNASAVYRYDGSTWKVYSTEDAEISVLQPKDYAQIGSNTIKSPDETLPTYLKQAYPYAQADDIVAVVYTNDKGAIVATEFIYNGMEWIKTTVAQDATIVFLKSGGDWIEAKVYYSSTLLDGESGGFTIQDIALDGLDHVWSLEPSYGWKASGYSNGNKNTESWLVSPEIDMSKAVAPTMKMDVCVNFLRANTVDDYFSINISTDYDGDVTTATWQTVTVSQWPAGDSYDFMTIEGIDLSAYAGQRVYLAFHYKSDAKTALTVEVKNLSIQE